MTDRVSAKLLVGVAVVGMAATGCGDPAQNPTTTPTTGPGWTPPPAVSAPAKLELDGAVPWVDERADFREFELPPRPPRTPPPAEGPPCRASNLRGELAKWIRKGGQKDDGEPDPVLDASLFGYVTLTNVGRSSCILQGEADTRLHDADGEAPMSYTHRISNEARIRKIGVPPKRHANLRLGWSAPFCQTLSRTKTLRIRLPHRGGTLTAPVRDAAQPGCIGGESQSELASTLSSSGFDHGPAPRLDPPPAPPLAKLKVSLAEHPRSGPPGEPLRYVIELANPTDKPIALAGPVGFSQYLTSRGMPGVEPFQISTPYRLNRRVIKEVPAHQSVRYAIVPPALAQLRPGLKVTITWKLLAPGLDTTAPQASFTVTITKPRISTARSSAT